MLIDITLRSWQILAVVVYFVVTVVLATCAILHSDRVSHLAYPTDTANLAACMIDASTTGHYVKSEEDLKSKRVAVLCGGSTESWIKVNNMASHIQCADDMKDAVDLVKSDIVDAVCHLFNVLEW